MVDRTCGCDKPLLPTRENQEWRLLFASWISRRALPIPYTRVSICRKESRSAPQQPPINSHDGGESLEELQ